MTMRISHEAIYRYIYVLPRGKIEGDTVKGLRQERAYRRKRKNGDHDEQRGKIADMLSIEERRRKSWIAPFLVTGRETLCGKV